MDLIYKALPVEMLPGHLAESRVLGSCGSLVPIAAYWRFVRIRNGGIAQVSTGSLSWFRR